MTNKELVVRRYPNAYCVTYASYTSIIYREPVVALPRGRVQSPVVLGEGNSPKTAWAAAATLIKKQRRPKGSHD
jgi:hypothetical protein